MKSLLILPMLLVVVVGGVGIAEAWDGQIDYESIEGDDKIFGDSLTFEIYLFGAELIEGELIKITTTERETGKIVKIQTIEQNNFSPKIIDGGDGWVTEFVRDTTDSDFNSNVVYDVVFSYDDASIRDNFSFSPPPAQQAVIAGETFAKMEEMKNEPKEIPEWVKEVFGMYYLGEIDDETLINSLQYLIKIGIIVV